MLDSFIDYIAHEKRFSVHTVEAYTRDLKQFFEFTGVTNTAELNELSDKVVRTWMVSLLDEGLAVNSIHRKIASLNAFFRWAIKESILKSNPARALKLPKRSKRLPTFVQEKDLQLDKVTILFSDDFEGLRDRMLFEMLYQTGMRLSELIHLRDSDFSPETVKVLGKRNKERIIPISPALTNLMSEYLRARNATFGGSDYFLVLNNGKKIYPEFVYRKINLYLRMLTQVDKKSPHVLRHTFATHLLNNGAGLEVLKALLGHSSLAATQVYTHNSFAELTKIYSQAHPRGTKK